LSREVASDPPELQKPFTLHPSFQRKLESNLTPLRGSVREIKMDPGFRRDDEKCAAAERSGESSARSPTLYSAHPR
jgi:hypothetical protein